jgi:hypothetical protein
MRLHDKTALIIATAAGIGPAGEQACHIKAAVIARVGGMTA